MRMVRPRKSPFCGRFLFVLVFVGPIAATAPAAQERKAASGSCVVIQELTALKPLIERGAGCSTRLSPASTFKIPHALVALETGVVKPDSVERWDGVRHEGRPEWDRDHTVISALRPSALWFFQRIAPRIGAERMSSWLARFTYGNRDVSGSITEYWVNGRLRISPIEQVAFLQRFYRGDLPVSAAHLRAVRQGLQQEPGTVQNATGVHRMPGDWTNATLNAKTGAATTPEHRVSWLVGLLHAQRRDYVFAGAVWRSTADVDALDGARLAIKTFIDGRLLR